MIVLSFFILYYLFIYKPKEPEAIKHIDRKRSIYLVEGREIPVRFMEYYLGLLNLENEKNINLDLIREAYLIEKEKIVGFTNPMIGIDQNLNELRAARKYMTDLCNYMAFPN